MERPIGQSFSIDGFRSLIDFQVTIFEGLNVMCGPNGSGKTNFLDFLAFISDCVGMGASNAISKSGGLAKVFSVENIKRKSPTIRFSCTGIADLNSRSSRSVYEPFDLPFFKFEYTLEIKFNRKTSSTYISAESVRLFRRSAQAGEAVDCMQVGMISITRKGPAKKFEATVKVSPRLYVAGRWNPLEARTLSRRRRNIEDIVDSAGFGELEPDESILRARLAIPAIDAVRKAVTRGVTYNIIPEQAREPNDVTDIPRIRADGYGLSAMLFYLRAASEGESTNRYFVDDIPSDSFDILKHWTRIIYPELSDIFVNKDLNSGKFLVSVSVGEEKHVRLPLQSLSDGTIKWLAIVSLLVSSASFSSLEEPENFLHPKVQSFLVDLIRESVSFSDEPRYFILSSHSETIINSCKPEEIILFYFEDSRTKCRRISNPDQIREQINETGFGLGYYYASGSIS